MQICAKCGTENETNLGQTSCARCGAALPEEPLPVVPERNVEAAPQHVFKPPLRSGFSWDRVIQIWWSIVWRQAVFGLVAGIGLGFIGGFLAAFAGRPDLATVVAIVLGWLGSIPLSVVVLRIALKKKYEEFSLKIVENEQDRHDD
jgi:hypothetical protein